MKTTLLFLFLLAAVNFTKAQSIQIDHITPTAVSGGINVHLVVTTFNGAGYLSHSYTVNGSTIDLSVCYWFNVTAPVFQITNDFFIPVTQSGNYTINVQIVNSSSGTVCDNFSLGPMGSANVLSNTDFETQRNSLVLLPNPTSGSIAYPATTFDIQNTFVYDQLGRLVKVFREREIDFNDLSGGVYVVRTVVREGSFVQKIVVRK